jgi:hypothetical protein
MAKKSSTMFYCGFCDMALKSGEGITMRDGTHYCSGVCESIVTKSKLHQRHINIRQNIKDLQGASAPRVLKFAKDLYIDNRKDYERNRKLHPDTDWRLQKYEICCYCHLANKNWMEAGVALYKYRMMTEHMLEKMMDAPDKNSMRYAVDEGVYAYLTNEENVRYTAIELKLGREMMDAMYSALGVKITFVEH